MDSIQETIKSDVQFVDTNLDKKEQEFKDFLEDNLSSLINCPITLTTFLSPKLMNDGFIYEKDVIKTYLKKRNISPMTRQPLEKESIAVPLINNIIEFADKKNLNVSKNKYEKSKLFIDNIEKIYDALAKQKYEKLLQYEQFIMDHSEDYSIFCYKILNISPKDELLQQYKKAVIHILNNCTNIEFKCNNWSIVHYFAHCCNHVDLIIELFHILKSKKIDINKYNYPIQDYSTPIQMLIKNGTPERIKCALESGIDITKDLPKFIDLVMKYSNDDKLCIELIDKLNNVNIPCNQGDNELILFKAISYNRLEIIDYLIKKRDADIYYKNTNGKNAIYHLCKVAAFSTFKTFIEKYLSKEDLLNEYSYGWKPIHIVSYYGTKEHIEYLLDIDIDVTTCVTKCDNQDVMYYPINLIELNTKIKDDDLNELSCRMLEMMQCQSC